MTLPDVDIGSMAWGDYDDDGRLDLLLAGITPTGFICEVWRNTGTGLTNIQAGFPPIFSASVHWSDVDNDNKLDALFSGSGSGGQFVAQIWRNTGSGFERFGSLTNTFNMIPSEASGKIDSGDFDHDGLVDVLMSGNFSEAPFCNIWRNNTNGFTLTESGFPRLSSSDSAASDSNQDGWLDVLISGLSPDTSESWTTELWMNAPHEFEGPLMPFTRVWDSILSWGDFNNDGWPDLFLGGSVGNFPTITPAVQLWLNVTNGFQLSSAPLPLPGLSAGEAAWGDFNNDGLSDLAITGLTRPGGGFELTAQVWGNAATQFDSLWSATLEGERSSLAIGDYDNDGRLDLVHSGATVPGNPPKSALLRNISAITNTPPSAPSGLLASIEGDRVRLSWNAASDLETPSAALTYNVRVGTSPGGTDIISPMSAASGHRKLPRIGNVSSRLFTFLQIQPGVTYHWSVQAVDGALTGGPFASESTFPQVATPPVVTGIVVQSGNQIQLTFTGAPGLQHRIEATSALLASGNQTNAWTTLGTGSEVLPGLYEYLDQNPEGTPQKFYRIVTP